MFSNTIPATGRIYFAKDRRRTTVHACDTHRAALAAEGTYRFICNAAEAGQAKPCTGQRCAIRPGLDYFAPGHTSVMFDADVAKWAGNAEADREAEAKRAAEQQAKQPAREARNAGIARITAAYRAAETAEWKARAEAEAERAKTPTTQLAAEGTIRDGLTVRVTAAGSDTSFVLEMLPTLLPGQTDLIARRLGGYAGHFPRRLDSATVIAALHGLNNASTDCEKAFAEGLSAGYAAGLDITESHYAANLASDLAVIEYHHYEEQDRLAAKRRAQPAPRIHQLAFA